MVPPARDVAARRQSNGQGGEIDDDNDDNRGVQAANDPQQNGSSSGLRYRPASTPSPPPPQRHQLPPRPVHGPSGQQPVPPAPSGAHDSSLRHFSPQSPQSSGPCPPPPTLPAPAPAPAPASQQNPPGELQAVAATATDVSAAEERQRRHDRRRVYLETLRTVMGRSRTRAESAMARHKRRAGEEGRELDAWTARILWQRAIAQPVPSAAAEDVWLTDEEVPPPRDSRRRQRGTTGWSSDSSIFFQASSSSGSSGSSGGPRNEGGAVKVPRRDFQVEIRFRDAETLRRYGHLKGLGRSSNAQRLPPNVMMAGALIRLIETLGDVNVGLDNRVMGRLVRSLQETVLNAWEEHKRQRNQPTRRRRLEPARDGGRERNRQVRPATVPRPKQMPIVEAYQYPRFGSSSSSGSSQNVFNMQMLSTSDPRMFPIGEQRWSPIDEDPFLLPRGKERKAMFRGREVVPPPVFLRQLEFEDGMDTDLWKLKIADRSSAGLLGIGGQAAVFKVRHRETHQLFALKIFIERRRERPEDIRSGNIVADHDVVRESRSLMRARHAKIVELHGNSIPYARNKHIIIELMQGSLDNAIEKGLMGSRQIWKMFIDVLCGLERIHQLSMIHHDLSPDNIMFRHTPNKDGPDHFVFKITDFGLCVSEGTGLTGSGKASMLPPECITGMDFDTYPNHQTTTAIDIWLLFALLVGFWDSDMGLNSDRMHMYWRQFMRDGSPYSHLSDVRGWRSVVRHHFREKIDPLRPWSAMLSWRTRDRPTATQLLNLARERPDFNFSLWDDNHRSRDEGCDYQTVEQFFRRMTGRTTGVFPPLPEAVPLLHGFEEVYEEDRTDP